MSHSRHTKPTHLHLPPVELGLSGSCDLHRPLDVPSRPDLSVQTQHRDRGQKAEGRTGNHARAIGRSPQAIVEDKVSKQRIARDYSERPKRQKKI